MTATATLENLQATASAGLPANVPLSAPLTAPGSLREPTTPGFGSSAGWELAQRIAKAFAASDLMPQAYRGNLPNCLIALEIANRMGASPLMVAQNLYIVHGNPGWSSKFLIASFNQCGRFSSIRYEMQRDAKGKANACRAWAIEKATGERIEGAWVTLEMAQAEGWVSKNGSKWKTMPELMLQYRAAAFFVRAVAPELSMGLQTAEEVVDGVIDVPDASVRTIGELQQEAAAETSASAAPAAEQSELLPADQAPRITYAHIADALTKAKDFDALAQAASLISAIPDEQQRTELTAIYEKRGAQIGEQV
jgi:hypothetical protein